MAEEMVQNAMRGIPWAQSCELEVRVRLPRRQPLDRDTAWRIFRGCTRDVAKVTTAHYVDVFTADGIRTRAPLDNSGKAHDMQFCRKNVLQQSNRVCHGLELRLRYSSEVSTLPPTTAPVRRVRLSKRRSTTRGSWRIDFTTLYEGVSLAEAKAAHLRYEVEFEYTGDEQSVSSAGAELDSWLRYALGSGTPVW